MKSNADLKQRRIDIGLTQAEVAKAVGVSESTISRWESGDIANMKRSYIVAYAKALRTTPACVMGWTDYEEKEPATANGDGRVAEFIRLFSALSPEQKELAMSMMREMLKGR